MPLELLGFLFGEQVTRKRVRLPSKSTISSISLGQGRNTVAVGHQFLPKSNSKHGNARAVTH